MVCRVVPQTHITKAIQIDSGAVGGRVRLPVGFPILVWDSTHEPIEPVLRYVYDRYRKRLSSALSVTNDLKDWWAYLTEHEIRWNVVDLEDVTYYTDVMLNTVSPLTHLRYSTSTIRKRTGAVRGFYEWAAQKKLLDRPIDFSGAAGFGPSAVESIGGSADKSSFLPEPSEGVDDFVVALTSVEVAKIFKQLGPLPSERENDPRPSRDRLIGELALNTGMRRDEISNLTYEQIMRLCPERSLKNGACLLRITKTKGLRPRYVEVPNWLVDELRLYAETERADSLNARRGDAKPAYRFFLNGRNAKHNAGWAVKNDTIDRQFRNAVIAAGLMNDVVRFDPATSEQYVTEEPKFTFHALRHTFAIWRYYAEFAAGVHEPWKIVQALLGHKSLATTLAIYLRPCAVFESQVSDVVQQHFVALREKLRD